MTYYICHHGILGQKWGVMNGPPYPLSGSSHNASERKAGWQSSLKGGVKKAKQAVSDRVKKITSKKTGEKDTKEKEEKEEKETKEKKEKKTETKTQTKQEKTSQNTNKSGISDESINKLNLTDKQKKMIKTGAIAVGVAVAAVGAYELYKYSGITKKAAQAVNKKTTSEMAKAARDWMKNNQGASNYEYSKFSNSMFNKLKEANRSEYNDLVKTAWKNELGRQAQNVKSVFNAYDRSFKNMSKDVIEEYAAANNIRLNNTSIIQEGAEILEDVLEKIAKRKAA